MPKNTSRRTKSTADRPKNTSRGKRGRGTRPGDTIAENWLFGTHAVEAALANPARQAHRLVATKKAANALTKEPAIPTELATAEEISALLPAGALHQGLALEVAPLTSPDLGQVLASPDLTSLVILDQVTDPHNVGAIMRSAAAFGASAVVVQDRHAPQITGTLAKSASGAVEAIPLVRATNLARAIEDMQQSGVFVVGLAGEADAEFGGFELPAKVALVLGAEGPGLRRLTREKCDILLRLPISGKIESLNVSNAAAVALYAISNP